MKGKLTVFIEAHRADDVRYALRLHKEFKLDFTLLGAGRAGSVAGELAASGLTAALGPVPGNSGTWPWGTGLLAISRSVLPHRLV